MLELRIAKSKTQNNSATLCKSGGIITILQKDVQNVSVVRVSFQIRRIL